jgi:predicted lipoprotein with Yx(FWY)xxD motif
MTTDTDTIPSPTRPRPHARTRNRRAGALAGTVLVAALALSGCAGSGAATTTDGSTLGSDVTTAPVSPVASPAVKLAQTSLGKILVGPEGLTLYGFANDSGGASTCTGKCAEAWPPLIVGPDWEPGPELDDGIFATTTRPDGTLQLVAGKWPLYYYVGDSAPGDVNGQGSGDVWFVVDGTGTLVKTKTAGGPGTTKPGAAGAAAGGPTAIHEADSKLGRILVDGNGRTVYGFTKDADGKPTCQGACANAWPAVIVEDGKLPAGLDPAVFTVVARPDGKQQLKAGKWPLYLFSGDSAAGDVNGQGSGGVWFVMDGKGALIKGTGSGASPTTAKPSSGY